MIAKLLETETISIDPRHIAKSPKVKEYTKVICQKLKECDIIASPWDLILYANGRRLHPNEKGDKFNWPEGLSVIFAPACPKWEFLYMVDSTDITTDSVNSPVPAGKWIFHNPERCTIYDLVKTIINRIFPTNTDIRQIKLSGHNSLNPEAQLSAIDNSSRLRIIKKLEKSDTTGYIQITISFEDGSTMRVKIKGKSKISKLKWILACKCKRVSRLIKNNMHLNDDETIESLGIKNNDYIEAQRGALGGAQHFGFRFANLEDEKEVRMKFDKNAPVWRTVKRGISFKTRCYNSNCEASRYGGWILVNKGFGVFYIAETCTNLVCPACGQRNTAEAENCGFFDCKWRFKGARRIENSTRCQVIESDTSEAGRDTYTTFEESIENWTYIKIEVREKDQEYWMGSNANWN